jgi:hypothetical protein
MNYLIIFDLQAIFSYPMNSHYRIHTIICGGHIIMHLSQIWNPITPQDFTF